MPPEPNYYNYWFSQVHRVLPDLENRQLHTVANMEHINAVLIDVLENDDNRNLLK